MDLANLATAESTSELDILHPLTGEKTGIRITLLSLDNPKVSAVRRRMQKAVIKADKAGVQEEVVDDIPGIQMDTLLAATLSWSDETNDGCITYNGQRLPCTAENVRKVYEAVPVIRDQVDEFIRQRKHFMRG